MRREPGVALVLLDIDRFRIVNRALGHQVGDEVLAVVAERLLAWASPNVTVGRVGDDEFALIIRSGFDARVAIAYGTHLVALLGQPMVFRGERLRITVSVGIALSDSGASATDYLLLDADLALTRAKHLGGNRFELLDETARRSAVSWAQLEADLRNAVDDRQLGVHFQPVVRFDGTIVSVEALARWSHPRRGSVSPCDFIPLAEEAGLISLLGAQMIEMAAEQVARWRRSLTPWLQLSVNVSARQLAEEGAAGAIRDALSSTGLMPSAVCLELTETAFLEDHEHAAAALAELRAEGMEIAVDDFGTAYSSLLYVHRFPVQALKIDRSFVAGLGSDRTAAAIIGAVIQLAHSLGLTVIAEGVETEQHLRALRDLGCDLGQGYYWCPPLPAMEMEALLRRGNQIDPG
ncbi:MAG: putative bifunctional diguanylate cyclase/phosphodiesterase [Acidimicrobiales bacterium]|jgi:diguanylate cyclase (GGDEF)-like protein